MKSNPNDRMFEGILPKIFDEKAYTFAEVKTRLGACDRLTRKWLKQKVENGDIEQVWRKGTTHPIPAYRIKKTNKKDK